MSDNPYASPSAVGPIESHSGETEQELAGRFTRLVAAMVDSLLLFGILFPIQLFTGFFERAQMQQVGPSEGLLMSLLGIAIMLLLNGFLLHSRGQTIGKALTRIQIVDSQTSKLLPFVRVYVLRYLWTFPLVVLVIIIPGIVDDQLLNFLVLIDVLLIFGATRRCLHDHIAGSKVVMYRQGRTRLEGQ